MWREFREARGLAPTFQFSLACARAGLPLFVIAPPSGGKSTIVFALEKYLTNKGEEVRRISRLGLRDLQELANWLNLTKSAVLINEDYANIGSSEYMLEKMAELIGSLSYSKTYQAYGMKVDVRMYKLGFVSGCQAEWLRNMMESQAFITFIREKFIRFYELPYTQTKTLPMLDAIEKLVNCQNEYEKKEVDRIPNEFLSALSFQLGKVRAEEYAFQIAEELTRLIKRDKLFDALRFYAKRLAFENEIIQREIGDAGYEVNVRWKGYKALYWVLRMGAVRREDFMDLLGVSSIRSVDRCIEEARASGWITSYWNTGNLIFIPTDRIRKVIGI
jgi:hypothetical protein